MKDTPTSANRATGRGARAVRRDVTGLLDSDRFDAADLTYTLVALQELRQQLWRVSDSWNTHPNTATWARNEVERINKLIDLYIGDTEHRTGNLAARAHLEEQLLKARGVGN